MTDVGGPSRCSALADGGSTTSEVRAVARPARATAPARAEGRDRGRRTGDSREVKVERRGERHTMSLLAGLAMPARSFRTPVRGLGQILQNCSGKPRRARCAPSLHSPARHRRGGVGGRRRHAHARVGAACHAGGRRAVPGGAGRAGHPQPARHQRPRARDAHPPLPAHPARPGCGAGARRRPAHDPAGRGAPAFRAPGTGHRPGTLLARPAHPRHAAHRARRRRGPRRRPAQVQPARDPERTRRGGQDPPRPGGGDRRAGALRGRRTTRGAGAAAGGRPGAPGRRGGGGCGP